MGSFLARLLAECNWRGFMKAILVLYTLNLLAQAHAADAADVGPDRGAVVAALKHQEGLVKSLQVDYEFTMLPTSPRQAALIRDVLPKKLAAISIFGPEFAKNHTGTARYWRKGDKGRKETSSVALVPKSGKLTTAFDGQVLRSVKDSGPDGRPVAVIASAETGKWYGTPKEDPMAFLYLYYERPFSEVVAAASVFSSTVITRGNDRFYRVMVQCDHPKEHVLEFVFDDHFRQEERLLYFTRPQMRPFPSSCILF
jgi:hypothetical protein